MRRISRYDVNLSLLTTGLLDKIYCCEQTVSSHMMTTETQYDKGIAVIPVATCRLLLHTEFGVLIQNLKIHTDEF